MLICSFTAISCVSPHINSQTDFYLGLLDSDSNSKITHFEKALSCSNEYVRKAAAEELALLMSQGNELSSASLSRVRQELTSKEDEQSVWQAVFKVLTNNKKETSSLKQRVLLFLFDFNQTAQTESARFFNNARQFLLQECEKQNVIFSESETAAIEGRYCASRSKYNEALVFFRTFQEDGKWPSQIPPLFLEYPNLINDLGRTFQYTQTGDEGLVLFSEWEKNLLGENDDLRYRLIFYMARITSRMGQYPQAVLLYEKAYPLTASNIQKDACVWYILDLSMGSANSFVNYLEKYINNLYSSSSINNLLERLLQRLVSANDWRNVIRTFNLIKDKGDDEAKAAFAWIIVRTIEEGYLSAENKRLAASAIHTQTEFEETADKLIYTRIAYNTSSKIGIPSLYYRSLSAAALEMPLVDNYVSKEPYASEKPYVSEEPNNFSTAEKNKNERQTSDALQFILDFFNNDAASYAPPYVRALESKLSPDELRAVAQAFYNEEMYPQALRLVSLYINKDGYKRERRDFELLFPRPFLELTEKYAKEFDIAPALLFALIRTESAFQHDVISHAGAVGLTQLMKETAEEMAALIRRSGGPDYTYGELDRKNPELNIHIGAYYINYLMKRFNNDTILSLMSYNGGMTRIRRLRAANNLPVDLFMHTVSILETRDYGKRVTGIAAIYQELYY
ncbi:MAG: lytic transglycosylase domain-containing protein [Treponema sp.]|nr:lytic transglycosylase domain-containing protein [Treponema sp.]MCL2250723.1 lytic transglycosylase domain-containing protein [Treponema sp.]